MTKEITPTPDSLPFGKWIHEQRVKRNVSLEEIAAVTKVHINQLKYLEEDEREKLPAPAFVRGFLISYARHLGLNEDEVLTRFKESVPNTGAVQSQMQPIGKSLRSAQSASQPKVRLVESTSLGHAPATKDLEKPKPSMMKGQNILKVSGAVVVIAGIGMLISLGKRNKHAVAKVPSAPTTRATTTSGSAETTVQPPPHADSAAPVAPAVVTGVAPKTETPEAPPSAVKGASAPSVATTTAPTGSETTAGASKKLSLELHAVEQSWVNVRVDDKESSGMILAPGNNYTYDAERKIVLSLSDAGAVEIKWNGTWYAPPGFRGDVKSLTLPEQLARLTPKALASKTKAKKRKPKPEDETAAPAEATPATDSVPVE